MTSARNLQYKGSIIKKDMEVMEENFKKELKALLTKYDAVLSLEYDPCSDTFGMYDERMAVYFRKEKKTVDLADGYSLDESDL